MAPVKGGGWAHVFCALHIAEVTLDDNGNVDGVKKIDPRRWNMWCKACGERHTGAAVQCRWED
jgi:hypothetical protein